MSDHEHDVTIGEVHRILVKMDRDQGHELRQIKTEVKDCTNELRRLNGKVAEQAGSIRSHDERIAALNREVFEKRQNSSNEDLKELIEFMRDARGVQRFGRWLWALAGALIPLLPFVFWLLSGGAVHFQ